MKKKGVFVIGTRPDAIKMAPVIRKAKEDNVIEPVVVATSQHKEMLLQVIKMFDFEVKIDFNIMKPNQNLFYTTISVLQGMGKIMQEEKPNIIIVQGDTTSSFASALAGFYNKIPVAHIEAGLRTFDKYQPFPEEINRVYIDHIADLCFAPTNKAKENLLRDGISEDKISITGNTGIDALLWIVNNRPPDKNIKRLLPDNKKLILLTAHRRENFGKPLNRIFSAIKRIAEKRDDIIIIYPVHPNPNVKKLAEKIFKDVKNIILIPPVDYPTLAYLLSKAYIVLTDSGGIQEEAPTFGVPVFVLREKTERGEGVEAGISKLLGSDEEKIYSEVNEILDNPDKYKRMSIKGNPYGDGKASERIVEQIKEFL